MTALVLLLLCFYATALSGDDSTDSVVLAAPGDVVILPCYNVGNVTPTVTTWMKNGREIISGSSTTSAGSPTSSGEHLTVQQDGSLNIRAVLSGDEGTYLCASTLPGNYTFHARVLLQVASGPENLSVSIEPATVLPNGTLTITRGSTVSFTCSADSYPYQQLTWSFNGLVYSNSSLANNTGSTLEYRIEGIQPNAQGNYTCRAHNNISHEEVNKSTEVLVYYAADRHPECMWTTAEDSSFVVFHCFWFGAYPTPTLNWTDVTGGQLLAAKVTDSLAVRLNRSVLSDGQTLRCKAQHQALAPEKDMSCTFTLKSPYPVGEPLATALDGTSVTLSCKELTSTPPANTTWRRGLQQELIMTGSKYIISEEDPLVKLTILNITKDDEGVYFCHSENPMGVRELEVYLTVKSSSAYTGAVVGLFIAVLIVGSAVIIAKTLYSNRHRICLGGGFGRTGEDRGDVLSLVDSDDEQIFQDSVPRLPPVTNGCQTTLVEIHRIPSNDHDNAEPADANSQQQDDTENTSEPEDLVLF